MRNEPDLRVCLHAWQHISNGKTVVSSICCGAPYGEEWFTEHHHHAVSPASRLLLVETAAASSGGPHALRCRRQANWYPGDRASCCANVANAGFAEARALPREEELLASALQSFGAIVSRELAGTPLARIVVRHHRVRRFVHTSEGCSSKPCTHRPDPAHAPVAATRLLSTEWGTPATSSRNVQVV